MSDVQNTTVAAETPATEPVVAQPTEHIQEASKPEATDSPVVESAKPVETATENKDESAPVEAKKDEVAAEKTIEPISEGQLSVKAPGFIKSIIPAKREFWLSDDAVSSKDLSSYMRGEKAEVSHDVVAWASTTGKGLLFFNKKGESKKQPSHVLALYDATDLKKQAPHEIAFKLHNQEHVLKATSDAERDGWYLAIERSMETGKAIKEETRESEGYKAEKEKLDKPISAVGAAAAAKRTQSQPKKSTEVDKADAPERKNSEVEEDDKKDKKSRSTSRGVFERLKSNKKEEKVEKKPETEEVKPEEDHKTEEAAAGVAAVGAVGAGAAVAEGSSSEDKKEETTESPIESKTEDKPKPQKRGSIFGKMQAGWGSLKSPQKEKDEKDAELKPDVPPKDEPVSEHPPQIAATNIESTEPAAEETKAEEVKPTTPEEKKDATTPGKEKKNFLSTFLPRNRSVSPSTPMKDAPAKTEETAAAEVPKEAEPVEAAKADEAVAETTAVEPLKPAEEAPKSEKRQSVLGSLGRRASKAFKGIQTPKKENTAPTTEATKEETAVAAPVTEEATTDGEVKSAESTEPKIIGDVVPDAITAGKPEHQPAAVAASA